MTDLAGMHSYFWLASSRLREPIRDEVPYTTQALRQDLLRVRNAWEDCQAKRDRDAIYSYLIAVFDLVAWWTAEGRALDRADAIFSRLLRTLLYRESFCEAPTAKASPLASAVIDRRYGFATVTLVLTELAMKQFS
jgi:hypothetical protein